MTELKEEHNRPLFPDKRRCVFLVLLLFLRLFVRSASFFCPEFEVGVKSLKLFRACLTLSDEELISRTCALAGAEIGSGCSVGRNLTVSKDAVVICWFIFHQRGKETFDVQFEALQAQVVK